MCGAPDNVDSYTWRLCGTCSPGRPKNTKLAEHASPIVRTRYGSRLDRIEDGSDFGEKVWKSLFGEEIRAVCEGSECV